MNSTTRRMAAAWTSAETLDLPDQWLDLELPQS
eukprot:CAMPEP_0181499284 /NCGR_PEP_ID=MMETSP1110-20121109/54569_1 /TAXON_ID=174948 /ORGANISM="Symbiodinium sp., Strain CCMP421" /LENGTH=32 /DNA_ID= /DNA_START= /DNA_END= /DNA_ORIENTATION=